MGLTRELISPKPGAGSAGKRGSCAGSQSSRSRFLALSPDERAEVFLCTGEQPWLEVEAEFCRKSSWRHVMGSAESREEIVKRLFVQQVDRRQAEAPSVLVAAEKVVLPHGKVEEVAG